jgi:hypothetical protein
MRTSLLWFLLYLSAQTATSLSPPASIPSLDVLSLPPNNGVHASNISHFANVTDIAFLPYKFHVPDTRIYLHLGFGLRRRPLDPVKMGSLIAVAEDFVNQGVEAVGRQSTYPPTVDGWQRFAYDLGDGIELWVENLAPGLFWRWGSLKDVLEGMRLYLIEGMRFRRTYLNFA